MSTEAHLIKVVDTAPTNNMRADEIAIETAKTGTVTAVIIVMSIILRRSVSQRVLILETRSLLAKIWKVPISQRKFPRDHKAFLRTQEKAGYQKIRA